jgi:hypothetical protein
MPTFFMPVIASGRTLLGFVPTLSTVKPVSRIMPLEAFYHRHHAEFPVQRISTRFISAIWKLSSLCEALRHSAPVWATTAPALGKGMSR